MKNHTSFFKGAAVGVALGVGAMLFLNSKSGKKLQGKAKEMVDDFYAYIGPKLQEVKEMGKEEYQAFMKNAVEEYSKMKKLSMGMASKLARHAQDSWDDLLEYKE